MGSVVDGIYRPSLHETGWDDEVNANFARLADLGLNVKGYSAVGDGVANDTSAFQSAHDALGSSNGVLYAPPGTFKVQGLNWTAGSTIIQGAGRGKTILKTSSGDLLNIGTNGSNYSQLTIRDCTLQSGSGGGHILVPAVGAGKVVTALRLERVTLQQDNDAKRIYHGDGPGIIDSVFDNVWFQHTLTGSVNPMYFRSANGDMNTVKFTNRCRFVNSRDQGQFIYVESTAASSYAYDWTFEDCTGEILRGGFLKGLGMFSPRLTQVNNWDMAASGTSTSDFLYFGAGSGGALTRDVDISQVQRRNGTLGTGNDITFAGSNTVLGARLNQLQYATLSGFTVDLGTNPGVLIENCHNNVTFNNRSGNTIEVFPSHSTATVGPKVRFGSGPTDIICGSGTPEAAVTATVGSLFMRTNGGAGTSLYVKESGSGNTGWVAK